METLFDTLFQNMFNMYDVFTEETDNGLDILIAVPGFKKDEITIEVQDQILSIKGKSEKTYAKAFSKRYKFPDKYDPEKITANHEDGILRISLHEKPNKKPKLIKIS
jgi:HSP20 family protein